MFTYEVSLMVKDRNAVDLNELLEIDLTGERLRPYFDLVAKHSWWGSPAIYKEIQVVYPKTRRNKGGNEKRGQLIDDIRIWDNQPANIAFWLFLGKNRNKVKNAYVCHIYDGSAWDPNHYTNLANLTAFPKSIHSLSEWKPIQDLLKYHSYKRYEYKGPDNKIPEEPQYYPKSWSNQMAHTSSERCDIVKKLKDQRDRRPECKGR